MRVEIIDRFNPRNSVTIPYIDDGSVYAARELLASNYVPEDWCPQCGRNDFYGTICGCCGYEGPRSTESTEDFITRVTKVRVIA